MRHQVCHQGTTGSRGGVGSDFWQKKWHKPKLNLALSLTRFIMAFVKRGKSNYI